MDNEKRFLTSKKFLVLNDATVSRLKKKAKAFRKNEFGKDKIVSQSEALNYVAKSENFNSWRELIEVKNYEEDAYGLSYMSENENDFCKYDYHTIKQLIGSLCRRLNEPPNSISPVIQVAVPEVCFNANNIKINHYLFENYFVYDNELEFYLSDDTTYFEDRVDLFGGMHFLRLLQTEIYNYREVFEYIEDICEKVGKFDDTVNADFIWINGKSSKYMQNQALLDSDGSKDEWIESQSYFELPEEIWKMEIY